MDLRLPRSTPVVLLAAGCLLLGSTGGAVAGAMITGKQIKDNTVTTKDIKNGSLAVKDLSKQARAALSVPGATGTAGAIGATGPAGVAGPRGFSAWDPIPTGVTVSGLIYDAGRTGTAASLQAHNVEFPAKAPSAPVSYGFGPDVFGATTTDPACTGTFDAATAPAGRVCVYLDSLTSFNGVTVSGWPGPQHAKQGFHLLLSETSPNTLYSYVGSWAYTAP